MYMNARDFINALPLPERVSRGFVPLYHSDTVNHCPACGHRHWHIGRSTAECAFCETALPLAAVSAQPAAPRFTMHASRTLKAA
jgi:hypothetical protein